MNWLIYEWRLFWRSPLSLIAILLLLVLTSISIWSGLHEMERERQTIARLVPLHQQDVAEIAAKYADVGGAGNPAYYTFHNTWDEPSDATFLALGMRDTVPYVLRVRALGLQAQLYEGEVFNPELALSGRFDFAFVLIYLAPLFVIALLHDLISVERQSGRLRLLISLPNGSHIWRRRVVLRYGLLFGCLIVPVIIGTVVAGTALSTLAMVIVIVASYLAFWTGLTLLLAVRGWNSVSNATALMATWVMSVLVLPTLANVALVRTIPVHQGVDLMLAQRQIVHAAWEIPREETMRRFFSIHPEWKDTAPLQEGFHWKWYFAFHQVGDDSVAEQAQNYRDNLLKRQMWTNRLGWLLPSVGVQVALHQFANTDLPAQLRYQDQIVDYHRQIRMFYYPYLFSDLPFSAADFKAQPVFKPKFHETELININLVMMLILCWLIAGWGMWGISKK